MKIFQSSSDPHFNATFATMEDNINMSPNQFTFTCKEILMIAERRYNKLVESGDWLIVSTQQISVFRVARQQNDNQSTRPGEATCWRCGEQGHYSQICTNPHQSMCHGGRCSGRGGCGGGDATHEVSMGGNGNMGGGGQNQNNNPTRPKHPMCMPPSDGQPQMRSFNGITLYWCTRCKCWNLSHSMDQHRGRGGGGANVAVTTGGSTHGGNGGGGNGGLLSGNGGSTATSSTTQDSTTTTPQTRFMASIQRVASNQCAMQDFE